MLGNPTRHCALRLNKSCFFFLIRQFLLESQRALLSETYHIFSHVVGKRGEREKKKKKKKKVKKKKKKKKKRRVNTHRQRRTEYPPRSGSAFSLALSCFLRSRFTFIKERLKKKMRTGADVFSKKRLE